MAGALCSSGDSSFRALLLGRVWWQGAEQGYLRGAALRSLEGAKRAGGDEAFFFSPSFWQVLPCLWGPLPFLSLIYSRTRWLFPASRARRSRVQLDSYIRHSTRSSTSLPELEGRSCR